MSQETPNTRIDAMPVEQLQALSLEELNQHIRSLADALQEAKDARTWHLTGNAKSMLELPAKIRGSSTELLIELRMMFQLERMQSLIDSHEHALASIRVAAVEQELTARCAECVQYINDRAYVFANGRSYWGAEALRAFEELNQ